MEILEERLKAAYGVIKDSKYVQTLQDLTYTFFKIVNFTVIIIYLFLTET